jgi:hypothetical protein
MLSAVYCNVARTNGMYTGRPALAFVVWCCQPSASPEPVVPVVGGFGPLQLVARPRTSPRIK